MNSRTAGVLLAVAALMLMSPAHAQSDDDGPVENGGNDDTIDEITVRGQQPPHQLWNVVIEARLDFWDVYNSLNTIDDYRVVCRKTAPTGSNIKKLRCVPKYFSDAMAEKTQEQLLLGNAGGPAPQEDEIISLTRDKKAAADNHMIGLIESNPLLLEKYQALLEANEAYERSVLGD